MPDELAFLRVVPLLKAGRHSVAGDEAGLAIAGQRVGIIQLVAVEIRLIERQVEAAGCTDSPSARHRRSLALPSRSAPVLALPAYHCMLQKHFPAFPAVRRSARSAGRSQTVRTRRGSRPALRRRQQESIR